MRRSAIHAAQAAIHGEANSCRQGNSCSPQAAIHGAFAPKGKEERRLNDERTDDPAAQWEAAGVFAGEGGKNKDTGLVFCALRGLLTAVIAALAE